MKIYVHIKTPSRRFFSKPPFVSEMANASVSETQTKRRSEPKRYNSFD